MPPRPRSTDRPPPHDVEAEEGVLGAILVDEGVYDELTKLVSERDFYTKRNRVVWRAMQSAASKHALVDATTVLHELRDADAMQDVPGDYLIHLKTSCASALAGPKYADIVSGLARRRRVIQRAGEIASCAFEGDGYRGPLEQLMREVLAESRTGQLPEGLIELWELCEQELEEYDWVIPGFLERESRLILFGDEGGGKSLLTLQSALQAANGLAVLDRFAVARPVDVLYVDLEMSQRSVRRRTKQFQRRLDVEREDGLRSVPFFSRPDGIDVTSIEGRAVFEKAVSSTRPDLVVVDAFYKLAPGDITFEKDVKPILLFLDSIRTEFHCALWIVHHPRKAIDGAQQRGNVASDIFGSSVLLRWPEMIVLQKERSLVIKKIRDDYFSRDQEIALRRSNLEIRKGGSWTFAIHDGPVITDLHQEILDVLAQTAKPMSGAAVRECIGKRTEVVKRALRDLVSAELVHTVPSPSGSGGHQWYSFGGGLGL